MKFNILTHSQKRQIVLKSLVGLKKILNSDKYCYKTVRRYCSFCKSKKNIDKLFLVSFPIVGGRYLCSYCFSRFTLSSVEVKSPQGDILSVSLEKLNPALSRFKKI